MELGEQVRKTSQRTSHRYVNLSIDGGLTAVTMKWKSIYNHSLSGLVSDFMSIISFEKKKKKTSGQISYSLEKKTQNKTDEHDRLSFISLIKFTFGFSLSRRKIKQVIC